MQKSPVYRPVRQKTDGYGGWIYGKTDIGFTLGAVLQFRALRDQPDETRFRHNTPFCHRHEYLYKKCRQRHLPLAGKYHATSIQIQTWPTCAMWEAPRTDHVACVPMNCTNINYMSIVAQYLAIVNYIKTIYRFRDGQRILSTYKIGRQYDFSAKCRKKRPQICDRFGYATVIFALSQSRCCPI